MHRHFEHASRTGRVRQSVSSRVAGALFTLLLIVGTACQAETPVPRPALTPTPEIILPTATPIPAKPAVAYEPVSDKDISPIVVQRAPEAGERMRVDGAIELVFDRAMDRASVQTAWKMQPAVAGKLAWSDARTVSFQPATALPRDATYDVALTQAARAQDGAALREPYQFRFLTQGNLEVGQVIPADGATNIQPDTIVTVLFNRPVVPLTTLQEQTALPQPLSIAPAIDGVYEWLNTSILTFRPARPLPGGTLFTARIAAGLTDTDGNPLAADYTWSFSTSAPKVLTVQPDPQDSRRSPIETPVIVRFNQNIDPQSAQAAFSLADWRRNAVAGAFEILGDTLIFTPANRLDFDSQYTIRVKAGVKSASGGNASEEQWTSSFTTVPLPKIERTEPANGNRNASYNTPFIIYFNTTIDPDTVMAHLRMTPPLSPTGYYTYYSDYEYAFGLYWDVQPATEYEVEIDPGIADPYGNLTEESLRVRFSTQNMPAYASIAVPDSVSTLNAFLPARVTATTVNVRSLDMMLSAFDPLEPRALLGSSDELVRLPDTSVRRWRQRIEGESNRLTQTRIDLSQDGRPLAPGAYRLEIDSPDLPNDWNIQQLVLMVSEINLVLKIEPAGALIWATDLKTGQPVPDVPITLYNAQYGQPYQVDELGTGTTDRDGVARIAVGRAGRSGYYDAVVAIASGRYSAISNRWSDGINSYDFGLGYGGYYSYSSSDRPATRGFIYTDRPIYRPGQTVYLRGVARYEDDVKYSLPPAGAQVHLQVNDYSGQSLLDKVLALDEYGAFNTAVPLPDGASLGRYTAVVALDENNIAYQSFTVSNYRPPEFEVTVEPAAAEIARNTDLVVTVTAKYLSGGALRNADVQWNALASTTTFNPPQLERYTFSDTNDPWRCFDCWYFYREPEPSSPVFMGAGRTDERGQLILTLPITTELRDRAGRLISGPVSLSVEANVTGAGNQFLAGRGSVLVHPADHYLGIALNDYLLRATRPTTVELVAADWLGARVPGKAFEVSLYRREWKNSYDEATGRWSYETIDELISATPATSDERGEARVVVTPTQAGTYRIVARGVDGAGRPLQSSRFVWATGPEAVSWLRENNDRVNLIASKTSFLPGETASILIPSPFEGEHYALVTVERGHILQHEVIRITSNSQVYQLPIAAGFVPNVYVSVVLFKGMPSAFTTQSTGQVGGQNADFKVGYIGLRVEPVRQIISVTLTPDRALAQPGETINYAVQATDSDGKPVAGQFSLDLVDKGILNLIPRPQNEIVDAFYGARGLSIQTSSGLVVSLNRLNEQQEEIEKQKKLEGQVLADGVAEAAMPSATAAPAAAPQASKAARNGESAPEQPAVRQNFADTAYWSPAVTTDADGRATVSIALPDNLTTWVLRAVGVDPGTRVGEGQVNIVSTKPLLIRPVTPRFMTVGDEIELGAVINNNTDQPQTAEVTLSAGGVSLTTPVTHTIDIPAQGEAQVAWTAMVLDAPQADLVFTVQNAQYADASKPRLSTAPGGGLKINRYSAPEVVGTAGDLDQAGSRTEIIALPPRLDTTQGELRVRLDPSLAASMQAGLTYLENYPYESADGIVSRFLPNVLTYQALVDLGIDNPSLKDKLAVLMRDALDKLYALQNSDGGWSWWRNETSSPHITAYAVFGMVRARDASFEVNTAVIDTGLEFLARSLSDTATLRHYYEFNRQAYLLYVLSEGGRHDAGKVAELFDARDQLSLYAKALLALTIGKQDARDERLKTIFADLNGRATQSATGAHWEEQNVDWWAMNTDTRSTAIVLSALARIDPNNKVGPNVVRWLMASRVDGVWRTTQENAWVLIALTDWLRATGELQANYEYAALLNNVIIAQGQATPQTITHTTFVTVPVASLLLDQGNRLTIGRGEGAGRLYYTAHLRAYLPVPTIKAADRGIQVFRRYTLASCADGARCPAVTSAKVGEVIRVNLTLIAPSELYYVQLEDALPAGAEVIDTGLATTSQLAQSPSLTRSYDDDYGYGWWWYWYSHSELRDDRVALFADHLGKGTYQYSYTLRATSPGQFNVIPTFVNETYFPEVFGRSDGLLFTVRR